LRAVQHAEAAGRCPPRRCKAADSVLRGRPNLGGFYAANDGMALGILQAMHRTTETTGEDLSPS
jgi:DNA-binding LacI/PurR family transcriptional regulator